MKGRERRLVRWGRGGTLTPFGVSEVGRRHGGGRDGESANLVAERSRRREEGALRREALAAVIGGGSSWEGVEDGACRGGGGV